MNETSQILPLNQVSDYNDYLGIPTTHPMVSVVDFSELKPLRHKRHLFGFYTLFLKEVNCGEMLYGRQRYDYQEGTILAIAPGQMAGVVDNGQVFQPHGWALCFHPDLIHGTSLGKAMKDYTFFSYNSNEALHMSDGEREIVLQYFKKIRRETQGPFDRHTRKIIIDNIESLLDYCLRFYERQFETRKVVNHDVLVRFEELLFDYYSSNEAKKNGLPTVKYFADHLFLSANYFGDLVKKETGISPRDYIQKKIIDVAKEHILNTRENISSVAYDLGFRYPQHFTRLFKKITGLTPQQYRQS